MSTTIPVLPVPRNAASEAWLIRCMPTWTWIPRSSPKAIVAGVDIRLDPDVCSSVAIRLPSITT
jgi:hypothetical protein